MNCFFLQTLQGDSAPADSGTNERVGREEQDIVSSADEGDTERSMLVVVEDKEDETTKRILGMFLNVLDSEVCVCMQCTGAPLRMLIHLVVFE